MKTRILVAAVGIPLLLAVIFFAPRWVFAVFVALVAGGSAWEFLRCAGPAPVRIRAVTAVFAAAIPLSFLHSAYGVYTAAAVLLLFLYIFGELIVSYERGKPISLLTVTGALTAGVVMPLLISALVRLGGMEKGALYQMLPFVIAFSCDSGAYFTGLALGRHKLAPRLSPKKTIEGALGGFLATIAFLLLYGLVLSASGTPVRYNLLAAYGVLGGFVCQTGDLCFSAVKRLCGIKDYGSLIPGHGGMLDRFDSITLVAPAAELLLLLAPAF